MTINLSRIMFRNRAMFLACDQGLEHGPKDFNEGNIDPDYIMNIALEGRFTGVIVQGGVGEKYWSGSYRNVPLIIKLNGKTSLGNLEPLSKQLCSVERAIKLGASAVGYTLYPGSLYEQQMFHEFSKIVEQAHDYGIPVIAWMYPRGRFIKNDMDNDILAYAARIGLELGADILKMKYNGDKDNFRWMVKCAGKTKIIISGGESKPPLHLLKEVEEVLHAGGAGIAVGRNVWQSDRPFSISRALHSIIFDNKTALEAAKFLK